MFTETLGIRIGAGPIEVSVLEAGIVVLGFALTRLLLVVARTLRHSLLMGVGIVGLSIALPAIPVAAPVVATVGSGVPSLSRWRPRYPFFVDDR